MYNQKYYYRAVLFITNAIAMILELIAARILSPCLGSSTTVWTIIISMMLLSNAFGNYMGGRLIEKYRSSILNTIILFMSGIAVTVIVTLNKLLAENIKLSITQAQSNAIAIIVILFMIPCILIGMESPIESNLEIQISSNAGTVFTVITAGSLIGTLLGGMIFIPKMGSNTTLTVMAVLLYILSAFSCFIDKTERNRKSILTSSTICVTGFLLSIFTAFIIKGDNLDVEVYDTGENYVRIYDDVYHGDEVKVMNIQGGFSSCAYKDPLKRDDLVFGYTNSYNIVLEQGDLKSFCMIGGAGYTYPRYLLSHYNDKTIDVVEIDGGITEIAKKHFYLQDFLDEYGEDNINLITDDGRLFLDKTDKKYDCILNDAFSGQVPARTLTTKEAVTSIKNSLSDNGIYATNIIGNIDKRYNNFLRSEIKTISSVFAYYWLIDTDPSKQGKKNWIVIASDYPYDFKNSRSVALNDDIIFTDDYAPVELYSGL